MARSPDRATGVNHDALIDLHVGRSGDRPTTGCVVARSPDLATGVNHDALIDLHVGRSGDRPTTWWETGPQLGEPPAHNLVQAVLWHGLPTVPPGVNHDALIDLHVGRSGDRPTTWWETAPQPGEPPANNLVQAVLWHGLLTVPPG